MFREYFWSKSIQKRKNRLAQALAQRRLNYLADANALRPTLFSQLIMDEQNGASFSAHPAS